MQPDFVVEITDPSRDDFPRLSTSAKVMPGQDFPFQGREERLGGGIVETRPDPSHRLGKLQSLAQPGEVLSGIGRAAVGVEDRPRRLSPPRVATAILIACLRDSFPGGSTGRTAQQPPGEQVKDCGEVELSLLGRDLGDVAAPFQVRPGRGEITLQQVRELWPRPLILPGQSLPPLLYPPSRPWRCIDSATVFSFTAIRLAQFRVDPRRAIGAFRGLERRRHFLVELGPPPLSRAWAAGPCHL